MKNREFRTKIQFLKITEFWIKSRNFEEKASFCRKIAKNRLKLGQIRPFSAKFKQFHAKSGLFRAKMWWKRAGPFLFLIFWGHTRLLLRVIKILVKKRRFNEKLGEILGFHTQKVATPFLFLIFWGQDSLKRCQKYNITKINVIKMEKNRNIMEILDKTYKLLRNLGF